MGGPRRTASRALRVVLTAGAIALIGGCGPAQPPGGPAAPASPAAAPVTASPPGPGGSAPPAAGSSLAGPDVRQLVVAPTDIPVPGFQPPQLQPLGEAAVIGVVARYLTADGRRQLGSSIVLLPDPAAARQAADGAADSTLARRPGATSIPATVGDHGVLISGYRLGDTVSTTLLFSQGTASVALEFRSPVDDPVPDDAVLATGAAQASRLHAALGS